MQRLRTYSAFVFSSLCNVLTIQPTIHQENIAQKRAKWKQSQSSTSQSSASKTANESVPPSALSSTLPKRTASSSSTSTRRIVSGASMADPNQDSAGGGRTWASQEKASDVFGNNFISCVLNWIWPGGVVLDWVDGRPGKTSLQWDCRYPPHAPFKVDTFFSAREGIIMIEGQPIAARTDGSLQIYVFDPVTRAQMPWSRQYYVLALEVTICRCGAANSRQSDTFRRLAKKPKRKRGSSPILNIPFSQAYPLVPAEM